MADKIWIVTVDEEVLIPDGPIYRNRYVGVADTKEAAAECIIEYLDATYLSIEGIMFEWKNYEDGFWFPYEDGLLAYTFYAKRLNVKSRKEK